MDGHKIGKACPSSKRCVRWHRVLATTTATADCGLRQPIGDGVPDTYQAERDCEDRGLAKRPYQERGRAYRKRRTRTGRSRGSLIASPSTRVGARCAVCQGLAATTAA